MAAARAEEGKPPQGSFTLAVRTLTGDQTTLEDVLSSQTVHAVTARLCVETGEEPTLTLLLHEQRPLADRKKALKDYGIVRDAELHVSPLLPDKALTTSCVAEADSLVSAAVEACGKPAVLKLRRANGKHKHRRWAHLERQGADVILVWGQHEDGSEQWQWKTFGSVPPKRRTVMGVREDMLPPGHANGHALGFAVSTTEGGDVLFVAESELERAKWLSALRDVAGAAALRKGMAAKANVDALVKAGCRSVEEMAALGGKAEAVAALPAEATKLVEFVSAPVQLSFRKQLLDAMSIQTIGALLRAGCRTWLSVAALSEEAVAALPGQAAQEVAAYLQQLKHFPYDGKPFGEAGLLFAIGTQGGEQPWRNPADAGDVAVRWSSIYGGCAVSMFVNRPPANPIVVATNSAAGSWMAVDLGAQRQLTLQHYALRNSGEAGGAFAPRNWLLEGAQSFDGPWTTLRTHRNDSTLPTRGHAEAAWLVELNRGAFRCFRVRATGLDAARSNYLCCAGIELYGVLV